MALLEKPCQALLVMAMVMAIDGYIYAIYIYAIDICYRYML